MSGRSLPFRGRGSGASVGWDRASPAPGRWSPRSGCPPWPARGSRSRHERSTPQTSAPRHRRRRLRRAPRSCPGLPFGPAHQTACLMKPSSRRTRRDRGPRRGDLRLGAERALRQPRERRFLCWPGFRSYCARDETPHPACRPDFVPARRLRPHEHDRGRRASRRRREDRLPRIRHQSGTPRRNHPNSDKGEDGAVPLAHSPSWQSMLDSASAAQLVERFAAYGRRPPQLASYRKNRPFPRPRRICHRDRPRAGSDARPRTSCDARGHPASHRGPARQESSRA